MGLIQIQKMSWPRCRMWFRYWRSSFLLCRFSQFEGWTSEPIWECSRGQRAWCMAQWWPGPAGPSPSPSPSSTKTQASLEHQGQVSLHPAHHCHCQCQPLFPEVWSLQRVTALCTPPHQAQPEHLKYNFSSMKRRRYYVQGDHYTKDHYTKDHYTKDL